MWVQYDQSVASCACQGENLDLAMSKEEVVAMIGDGPCVVKTLTRHHLYCEPPVEQPLPRHHTLREAPDALPEFTVSGHVPGWDGLGIGHLLHPYSPHGSTPRYRWGTCASPWAMCNTMARAPWPFPWQPRWA